MTAQSGQDDGMTLSFILASGHLSSFFLRIKRRSIATDTNMTMIIRISKGSESISSPPFGKLGRLFDLNTTKIEPTCWMRLEVLQRLAHGHQHWAKIGDHNGTLFHYQALRRFIKGFAFGDIS